MKGFIEFIKDKGVIGLAVGFVMGGAVSKLVTSFVTDIINPLVGLGLGMVGGLKEAYFQIGTAKILYGNLTSSFIDFLVIALVVYFGIKILGFAKIEKKKN
jgi:large conductance mechanosensitive channel